MFSNLLLSRVLVLVNLDAFKAQDLLQFLVIQFLCYLTNRLFFCVASVPIVWEYLVLLVLLDPVPIFF